MLDDVHQKFPTFGDSPFIIYTLVYQLMYHKLANKDTARRIARDNNQYSSEFYKFELSKSQKEYFDIILDREIYGGLLMSKEQKELVRNFKLDNLVMEMSDIVYQTVLHFTQNIKDKTIRDFMLTFVSDYELFNKYTDYVYKYSIGIHQG
jgi:hypothetical protein